MSLSSTISFTLLSLSFTMSSMYVDAAALTADGALDSVISVAAASYLTAGLDEFSNAYMHLLNKKRNIKFFKIQFIILFNKIFINYLMKRALSLGFAWQTL